MVLGLSMVVVFCLLGAVLIDEFPDKAAILASVAAIYAMVEYPQNGAIADSIEDAVFVVGYGAGLPLSVFDWIGGGKFQGDLFNLFPLAWLTLLHLAAGYSIREWQRRRA
jgi:hypothetical protein